ncbi:hypothetical protein PA598K_01734 [Paenibacillus sp. 598K]|nr:hypothetical protein PA598K_01734 [Paenibacillus sp. 598K]
MNSLELTGRINLHLIDMTQMSYNKFMTLVSCQEVELWVQKRKARETIFSHKRSMYSQQRAIKM